MRLIFLLLALSLSAQVHRESIEWCDVWMPNMKASGLPRVMLIGDSITRGYFSTVEEELKGKAYVARLATSKAIGDPALLAEVKTFLRQTKFDVVHVNIGMHGWDYSEASYGKGLPKLIHAIRRAAPGAKVIWAQTTPVRKDRSPGPDNVRITARNQIAKQYCDRHRIGVNDLHALMLSKGELHSDDVHFNKEGSAILGRQVAAKLREAL